MKPDLLRKEKDELADYRDRGQDYCRDCLYRNQEGTLKEAFCRGCVVKQVVLADNQGIEPEETY